MRGPAYANKVIGRRKLGERIGLLVVALHDWNAGQEIALRPNVRRVVLAEDTLPHELDWSCCVALDCLVVGECDESVFWAAVTMIYAAGAASIWGEFAGGVYRLERWPSRLVPRGFYADEGPIPVGKLGRAVDANRTYGLLFRRGVYGTPMFDAARASLAERVNQRMAV